MIKRIVSALVVCCMFAGANAQLNTDRLMSIGKNALYFDDYVLSIQYFNQVIKIKPTLIEPYYFRAVAKIELEDYYGAEQDLNVVLDRNPFIPTAYYARGYVKKKMGRWFDADDDFQKALEYAPDNIYFALNRIETLCELNKVEEAENILDRLIVRNPNALQLLYQKGRMQFEREDTLGAISTYKKMVAVDSLNPEVYVARGMLYHVIDSIDLALKDYNRANKLRSKSASLYVNRGMIYFNKYRFREAIDDYNKAVALEPDNANARFNRALLRAELGDLNRAVEDLDTIINSNPNFDEAVYKRAIVNLDLKYYNKAIADFTTIIEKYPSFVPALYGRAIAYETVGDKKAAFKDRSNAFKIEDDYRKNGNIVDSISTSARYDTDTSLYAVKQLVERFTQNTDQALSTNGIRGAVQNNNAKVEAQPSFVISYYKLNSSEIKKRKYNPMVMQQLNQIEAFKAELYLVNSEISLTEELVNMHFERINELTQQLSNDSNDVDLYLVRAFNYALVQDYDAAIADLTRVIASDKYVGVATFCRAYLRHKRIESRTAVQNLFADDKPDLKQDAERREYELIMRDYDQANELLYNFPFAWYNKANIHLLQNDYIAAQAAYTKAINIDEDFAEAYFNRALAYMMEGRVKNAIRDFSKAGELGLYQAYSIIKKLQE